MQSFPTNPAPGNRPKASDHDTECDADVQKGAVEDDRPPTPGQKPGNTTMRGQLSHRTNIAESTDPDNSQQEVKENDTDFPEPGSSPEHSGQHR